MLNKKSVLDLVLSFLLALSIGFFCISAGIYMGFIHHGSAQTAFNEIDGIEYVESNLLDAIDYSKTPTHMDKLVFDRIINGDLIHEDVKSYILHKYTGKKFEPNLVDLENSYYFNTEYILSEKDIKVSYDQDLKIKEYYNTFKQDYLNSVKISVINPLFELFNPYKFTVILTMCISLALTICLFVVIWFVSLRKKRLFIYSLTGGGIMAACIPIYLLFKQSYQNIISLSKFGYEYNNALIRNGLINIAGMGLIFIVVGVLLGVYFYLSDNSSNRV